MSTTCYFHNSLRWRHNNGFPFLSMIGLLAFVLVISTTTEGAVVARRSVVDHEETGGADNGHQRSSQLTSGQQQNHTAIVASSSSRNSFGTVDDYRNRIQNMFRLLENRPDQGCQSTRVYRFYCPTPHPLNPETGWVCIKIDDLCNNIPDCPGAEDEDPTQCMYYLAIQHQAYQLRTIFINQMQHQQPHSSNQLMIDDNEF